MPFRDVIDELLNKYIPSIPQDSIFFRCRKVSYNLESEILKAERIRQSLSQLDLSDGVYSNPSSISYYETSKRSPNKTTFTKLMDKFNLNKPKRSGFVLTESFDRLELFQKMREYANKQDYSSLLDLINNSSEYDSFEEPIITAYKCFASKNSKHEYDSETIEKLASIIDQRYPLSPQAQYRKPFLEECYLICTYLGLPQHEHEYLLMIYENIINHIEQSAISPKYSYSTYTSLAMNYISSVGKYMPYSIVTSISDKAIYYTLLCGNASCLAGLYWGLVRAFHKTKNSNINNSKKAYLFSELYKEKMSFFFKDYYYQWRQMRGE
ncbi:MAG: helix-turn-helix transcriptional regulator [Lachnospiraceae bacterium]|nr:helix-turn-helix transcriptional regulator [Lachnospiraceae bacterium]